MGENVERCGGVGECFAARLGVKIMKTDSDGDGAKLRKAIFAQALVYMLAGFDEARQQKAGTKRVVEKGLVMAN